MKEGSRTDILEQIVDDIISELPLKERVSFANMDEKDAEILQRVFGLYIRSKIGSESEDEEYTVIMKALWGKLRKTHALRVVK